MGVMRFARAEGLMMRPRVSDRIREKFIRPGKRNILGTERGLPSLVKGAGLRVPSRRGSGVQIPAPAPFYTETRIAPMTISRAPMAVLMFIFSPRINHERNTAKATLVLSMATTAGTLPSFIAIK